MRTFLSWFKDSFGISIRVEGLRMEIHYFYVLASPPMTAIMRLANGGDLVLFGIRRCGVSLVV